MWEFVRELADQAITCIATWTFGSVIDLGGPWAGPGGPPEKNARHRAQAQAHQAH
jgi:hypothetical protein